MGSEPIRPRFAYQNLTALQALEIAFADREISGQAIADKYGIPIWVVYKARQRKGWATGRKLLRKAYKQAIYEVTDLILRVVPTRPSPAPQVPDQSERPAAEEAEPSPPERL